MLHSLAPYKLNDDVSFHGEAQIICAFEASTFVLITACFAHVFCILVENFQYHKDPVKKVVMYMNSTSLTKTSCYSKSLLILLVHLSRGQ